MKDNLLPAGENRKYEVKFYATVEEKLLLSIAGMMIDYQYFENNTNTVK